VEHRTVMVNFSNIASIIAKVAAGIVAAGQPISEIATAKTPAEREAGIIDGVNAALGEIETFDPSTIKDQESFNAGVIALEAALKQIEKGIGK